MSGTIATGLPPITGSVPLSASGSSSLGSGSLGGRSLSASSMLGLSQSQTAPAFYQLMGSPIAVTPILNGMGATPLCNDHTLELINEIQPDIKNIFASVAFQNAVANSLHHQPIGTIKITVTRDGAITINGPGGPQVVDQREIISQDVIRKTQNAVNRCFGQHPQHMAEPASLADRCSHRDCTGRHVDREQSRPILVPAHQTAEVRALKDQVAQQSEILKELQNRYDLLQTEMVNSGRIKDLEDQLEKSTEENQGLRWNLDQAIDAIKQSKAEIEDLEGKQEELIKQNESFTKIIQDLENRLNQLGEENRDQNEHIESLNSEIIRYHAQMQKELAGFRQEKEEAIRSIGELGQQIDQLKEELKDAQRNGKVLEAALQQAEQEAEAAKDQIQVLEQQLKSKQVTFAEHSAQTDEDSRLVQLSEQNDELAEKLAAAVQKQESLEAEMQEDGQNIVSLKAELEKLREHLQQDPTVEIQDENNTDRLLVLSHQLSSQGQELDALRAQADGTQKELTNALLLQAQHLAKIEIQEQTIAELETARGVLSETINDLEKQIASFKAQAENYQQALTRADVVQAEARNREKTAKISELAEHEELLAKQAEIEALKKQLDAQASSLRSLTEQLHSKEVAASEAIEGQEKLANLHEKIRKELARAESELKQARVIYDERALEIENKAKEDAKAALETQAQQQKELDALHHKLDALRHANVDLQKQLEAAVKAQQDAALLYDTALEETLNSSQTAAIVADRDIEKAQEKAAELSREILELQAAMENNEKTIREKTADIQRQKEELAAAKESHTQAINQLKQEQAIALSIANARYDELNRQLKALESQMAEKDEQIRMSQEEIADLKRTQGKKILDQADTLSLLQKERDDQQKALKVYESEIEATKAKLKASEEAQRRAEKALSQQEQTNASLLTERQRDAAAIRIQRDEHHKELRSLIVKTADLEAQLRARKSDQPKQTQTDVAVVTNSHASTGTDFDVEVSYIDRTPSSSSPLSLSPIPSDKDSVNSDDYKKERSEPASLSPMPSDRASVESDDSKKSSDSAVATKTLATALDRALVAMQPKGAGPQVTRPSLKVDQNTYTTMNKHRDLLAPKGLGTSSASKESHLVETARRSAHHTATLIHRTCNVAQAKGILENLEKRTHKDFFDYINLLSKSSEAFETQAKAGNITGILQMLNQPVKSTEYGGVVKTKTTADRFEWSVKLEGYLQLLMAIQEKFRTDNSQEARALKKECQRKLDEYGALKVSLFKFLHMLTQHMIQPKAKESRLMGSPHSRQSSVSSVAGV